VSIAAALFIPFEPWMPIKDGDLHACSMFERHYSAAKSLRLRRERGTTLICGPGYKMVLATPCRRALFVWRKFISGDGQQGINCAVFRNEGAGLSSDLIMAADALADERWPGERHFTYVNPREVRSSNPGYCFLRAGWRKCGITKHRKLLILERLGQGEANGRGV
jgi:hypothetical protein